MAGARTKDISGSQTSFQSELVLLVDRIDTGSGDWLAARKLELGLLGNTYYQGSSNGINWHNDILAGDTYFRFSSDGGVTWRDLNTDTIREGVLNQYYTDARVSANVDVLANTTARHSHTNLSILENIIDSGPGTNFLTDDGTYKSISVLGVTLQDAYDSSTSPELLTDATRGALSIKRGTTLDTDNVFEVLNGVGTITGSIDGEGAVSTVGVKLNTTSSPSITPEGTLWWNGDEYTINITTGLGATIQVGEETLMLYYNDTGSLISNGSVLHPKAVTIVGGVTVPTPELADASKWELSEGTLSFATHDIANLSLGLATRFGKVRGLNTTGVSAGDQLWLSTTPGGWTNVKPIFPNYAISLGGALNSSSPDGEIFCSITKSIEDTFNDAWDGGFRETINFTVSSDGVTIIGSLENIDNTLDLTATFSSGLYTFDTTPAATVTLIAGTDTIPQTNYIYIPESTKVLTTSTSGFPSTEHIKIANVLLQSAATVQTYGALVNRNWNDHIKAENDNGHLLHISERIRQNHAEWSSGVAGTLTITTNVGVPDNLDISTTAGYVYQLHKQTIDAKDTSVSDSMVIVNDFTTPYKTVTDLNGELTDSANVSLSGKYWSFVLWGIANKPGQPSRLMINLPSGSYNSSTSAITDINNYSDYTIPSEFKGTGFLISRFTVGHSASSGGTWTLYATEDLRGFSPNSSAGGGIGGSGATTYLQLTDTPSTYTALAFQRANSGATALENVLASAINVGDFNNDGTYLADPMTTRGDIIIRDASNLTARLGVGTVGQVLTSDGTDISWQAVPPTSSPLTTKGDIWVYSTTDTRLPVGTDGQILSSDSTQATGLKWIAAGGTGTVTQVDAGNGLDFVSITTTGSVTLGTPSTLTSATTNAVTTTSHTHAITTGIADTNIVRIDDLTTIAGDYAKFTDNGILGRSTAEVKSDLSLNNVENTALSTWAGSANITTLGTIVTGVWTGTALGANYVPNHNSLNGYVAGEHFLQTSITNVDTTLATGLLKVTTTTGALSTAVAGTDYQAPITGGTDYLRPTTDVDDTPVNGETAQPISSNWAYDHAVGETVNLHTKVGTISTGTWNGTAIGDTYITSNTSYRTQVVSIACSDETTALTTGTSKVTFRMPFAMTVTAVRASVTTAPTGSTLQVDINEGGVSILSTVISIDATEKTSTTAATPPVISDSALADDAEITIDIDQVGSTVAGAGLKIYLIGTI